MACAEPKTEEKLEGPVERDSILILGGPKHNRNTADHGSPWFVCDDEGRQHEYIRLKLRLTKDVLGVAFPVEKTLYVHNEIRFSTGGHSWEN
jgi:hypothetical protein